MRYILIAFTIGTFLIFAGIVTLLLESLHIEDDEGLSTRTRVSRQASRQIKTAWAIKLVAIGTIMVLLSAKLIGVLAPPQ